MENKNNVLENIEDEHGITKVEKLLDNAKFGMVFETKEKWPCTLVNATEGGDFYGFVEMGSNQVKWYDSYGKGPFKSIPSKLYGFEILDEYDGDKNDIIGLWPEEKKYKLDIDWLWCEGNCDDEEEDEENEFEESIDSDNENK